MKTFYGGIFIEKEKLEEAGIYHPIKLEYYKRINEDELYKDQKAKYGISIIKTEYIGEKIKVDTKEIQYLSNDEQKVEKVLEIFKENAVTPINSDEVIKDLATSLF